MTVLSACQSAATRLIGERPTTIFSSSEKFEMELADLSTETAIAIAKAHDWQRLTKMATLTGDGSTVAFSLPADYDRMMKDGGVHSSLFSTAMFRKANDLDEWLFLQDEVTTGIPGNWIILGGEMQILPAISSNETARFYYISNQIVSGGKSAFSDDNQQFVLPERLLTLGLIWRWRAQKRMEYAEDLANYEIALSEEIGRDKGQKPLTIGHQRIPAGVNAPYPGNLGV